MDKIAFFIPSFNGGGAQKVIVNLANAMCKKNYQVDLLVVNNTGPFKTNVNSKISIVDLSAKRLITSLIPLIKYLNSEKPSILITAMTHVNLVAIIAKMLYRSNCKIIVTEHSNTKNNLQSLSLPNIIVFKSLIRYLYPKADKIVAVSDGVAKSLSVDFQLANSKIQTIYNPIVSDDLIIQSKKTVNHKWLNEKKIPVFLSVGRLSPEKDYPTLIRAFDKVRMIIPSKLIILGEGASRAELSDLIIALNLEKDVDLYGFCENPYAFMRSCDVFVLTSLWEGFGNVLAEALVCNTKVISTNCESGPSEILENGKWGTLVHVSDVNALAEAMISNIHKRKIKTEIRANDFTIEKSVNSYIQLFG